MVERAHHHQLWSRVSNYQPALLDRLLTRERAIFEYWSHAAAYVPMSSYRFCLPRMRSHADKLHWSNHSPELVSAMQRVLDRIRIDGPLQARDFAGGPSAGDFWGFSKIERRVLHELFMRGDVMVVGRAGFSKIFDLPERFLPEGLDRSIPTEAELMQHRIREAIRAQGIASPDQIGHQRSLNRKLMMQTLAELIEANEIREVKISGLDRAPAFAFSHALEKIPRTPSKDSNPARILSPFDAGVIHRKRVRELFGFDYQIECYTPAAKRKHGYFSLPVLAGGGFIGRIDAKADRPHRRLIVRNFVVEPGVNMAEARAALDTALPDFAAFNGCETWSVSRTTRH
ncbi:hypothetical protein AYO41_02335 [Verrucomicrobia bacterium SCGC AG-212-E04]|nr:hypothetical protein AYO41_02335 [Verrucomicrobia bacterium SCGC AG-212-E04]